MTEQRAQKINELIKEELGKIIFEFLDTKAGILVTITRVMTSSNLFTAVVLISIYPAGEANKIMETLNRSIYEIQQLLNDKLKMRPVPKIIFKYDKNPEEAARVEELLEKIKK